MRKTNDRTLSYLVGGLGEKKSNSGTQYYQQDRIYKAEDLALAIPANLPSGSYIYLIEESEDVESEKTNTERMLEIDGL